MVSSGGSSAVSLHGGGDGGSNPGGGVFFRRNSLSLSLKGKSPRMECLLTFAFKVEGVVVYQRRQFYFSLRHQSNGRRF